MNWQFNFGQPYQEYYSRLSSFGQRLEFFGLEFLQKWLKNKKSSNI